MPVYDIVPDVDVFDGWNVWDVTGGGTAAAALADSSDATYVKAAVASWPLGFELTHLHSYTGRLCSIGLLVRNKRTAAGRSYAAVYTWTPPSGPKNYGPTLEYPMGSSIVDSELLAHQGQDPDAAAFGSEAGWPPEYLPPMTAGRILLDFADQNADVGDRTAVYKALVRLYCLPAVTCGAPSAPTGTVTITQRPTCTVALALTVESWQLPAGLSTFLTGGDVEFAVYNAADAPDATPPVTPAPLWTSVTRYNETTVGARTPSVSATPDVFLPNGDYTVYARASRDLMSGAGLYWSDWAHAHWTQDVAVPDAPTLTAVASDALQRMAFTVHADKPEGYTASSCLIDLQRLVAGVWRDVRGVSGSGVVEDTTVTLGYDYECERGAQNIYRSRSSMILTDGGLRMYSPWAEVTVAGPALSGWNVKTPDAPANNWLGVAVKSGPEDKPQRAVKVFEPMGRTRPVVVFGTMGGVGGTLRVTANGGAEVALLESLSEYAGAVLLESAFGDVRYIAVTECSWARQGTRGAPRRTADVKYAEVACDLPTSAT
jgi:hypothetical protein